MHISRARIVDYAAYIGISLVVITATLIYAAVSNGNGDYIFKWIGLIVTTCILFGYAIWDNRGLSRLISFWLTMMALLTIHLSVFSIVLARAVDWKLIWFAVLLPFERLAIEYCLSAVVRQRRS